MKRLSIPEGAIDTDGAGVEPLPVVTFQYPKVRLILAFRIGKEYYFLLSIPEGAIDTDTKAVVMESGSFTFQYPKVRLILFRAGFLAD